MDKPIPELVFTLDGLEVLRLPAHLFLLMQSFRKGQVYCPRPGCMIGLQVHHKDTVNRWDFEMPEMPRYDE